MRNLTIKRTKSFVGCLAKMKVYIADFAAGDTMINNTPCRKLGTLKNGEEKTFEIDNGETRIFVIADKLSKEFCNEYYNIPEGDTDIYLSGQNRYNPASGNAFRFDGVTDQEVLQNRKKGSKIGIIVLIIAFIMGAVGGYIGSSGMFAKNSEPKDFSINGMTVTLDDSFNEIDMDGYTACYESSDVAVFALEEKFALAEGFEDYTLEQYGEMLLKNNGFDSSIKLQNKEGLTYFEYEFTNTETDEKYYYFSAIYKESDAFWMIQFTTLAENSENHIESFIESAKSVKFTN